MLKSVRWIGQGNLTKIIVTIFPSDSYTVCLFLVDFFFFYFLNHDSSFYHGIIFLKEHA